MKDLAGKRLALVGFADVEAERLCAACEKVGARPRLFPADEPPDSDPVRACDIVLVHVRPETLDSKWLALNSPPLQQPLVLAGGRKLLMSLEGKVQSRACELLIDGWQPGEALMRVSPALSRPAAPAGRAAWTEEAPPRPANVTPEVLIADDDMTVRTLVRSAVRGCGYACYVVSSGPDALGMLRKHRPHAAVLDVNMPGMDGFEVLSAARSEGLATRIILLTARQQENDILRGFGLGADDYVVKPFSPLELVARLKRLLAA